MLLLPTRSWPALFVVLQLDDWLAGNLPEGARVGLDPFCHTVDSLNKLKAKLEVSQTADQNLPPCYCSLMAAGTALEKHTAPVCRQPCQPVLDTTLLSLARPCFLLPTLTA